MTGGASISAIVIDDDLDTVELFSEYLGIKGIRVIGKGYDGREAVELYEKLRPDMIFLDVMMPHYDGFYALEHIKRLDPKAKIIMVTADLTSDTAKRLEEFAVGVVYKPFEFDDIMSVVEKLFLPKVGYKIL